MVSQQNNYKKIKSISVKKEKNLHIIEFLRDLSVPEVLTLEKSTEKLKKNNIFKTTTRCDFWDVYVWITFPTL